METITKEELVFLWLVVFGYKARVNSPIKISTALGASGHGADVRVKAPEFEYPRLLFRVMIIGKRAREAGGGYLWHLPDEWFDEVLGEYSENS